MIILQKEMASVTHRRLYPVGFSKHAYLGFDMEICPEMEPIGGGVSFTILSVRGPVYPMISFGIME